MNEVFEKTQAKIKLIKGQRDTYGWEITLPKEDLISDEDWIKQIKKINILLKESILEVQTINKLQEDKI